MFLSIEPTLQFLLNLPPYLQLLLALCCFLTIIIVKILLIGVVLRPFLCPFSHLAYLIIDIHLLLLDLWLLASALDTGCSGLDGRWLLFCRFTFL